MKLITTLAIFAGSWVLSLNAFAKDMDAAAVISKIETAEKFCVQGAPKLAINGLKIGTAADRNQIQADNGWKRDGVKGKNYLVISTRQKGKLVPFASYGPLDSGVAAEQLNVLLKSKICMVDEG